MQKIIFATGNAGKMREIKMIMADIDIEILSMKEAGINIDIIENGTSFSENAMIKAKAVASVCDAIVLADDSGLEIDYLNKQPGIYSARYMGEDTPYTVKNKHIIECLNGVPDDKRTARFVCAIAAVFPNGKTFLVEATMEGRIGYEELGQNGFGYDPIFMLPDYGCSTAELSPAIKNQVSHRGKALRMMRELIKDEI